jgi:DNA-binding NarL/FixJ family response regulator
MIRVGVIEDHPVYRSGLTQIIDGAPDLILAYAADSVEDAPQAAPETCQVVLLDLHLPGLSGPAAVAAVYKSTSAVLVLSASEAPGAVVEAMGAGAAGYLSKQAAGQEIVEAIRVVAGGGTYVSATLAAYLLRSPLHLGERECKVLELVAGGETDQDIAEILGISIRTVRSHLDRIRDKTGSRRRAALTRLALDHGITPPGTQKGYFYP